MRLLHLLLLMIFSTPSIAGYPALEYLKSNIDKPPSYWEGLASKEKTDSLSIQFRHIAKFCNSFHKRHLKAEFNPQTEEEEKIIYQLLRSIEVILNIAHKVSTDEISSHDQLTLDKDCFILESFWGEAKGPPMQFVGYPPRKMKDLKAQIDSVHKGGLTKKKTESRKVDHPDDLYNPTYELSMPDNILSIFCPEKSKYAQKLELDKSIERTLETKGIKGIVSFSGVNISAIGSVLPEPVFIKSNGKRIIELNDKGEVYLIKNDERSLLPYNKAFYFTFDSLKYFSASKSFLDKLTKSLMKGLITDTVTLDLELEINNESIPFKLHGRVLKERESYCNVH